LSLSITLLLFDLYFGAMIYYCWHTTSGLISEVCTSDRVLNDETVGHHAFFFIASWLSGGVVACGRLTSVLVFPDDSNDERRLALIPASKKRRRSPRMPASAEHSTVMCGGWCEIHGSENKIEHQRSLDDLQQHGTHETDVEKRSQDRRKRSDLQGLAVLVNPVKNWLKSS
jgi:hypothetical protein